MAVNTSGYVPLKYVFVCCHHAFILFCISCARSLVPVCRLCSWFVPCDFWFVRSFRITFIFSFASLIFYCILEFGWLWFWITAIIKACSSLCLPASVMAAFRPSPLFAKCITHHPKKSFKKLGFCILDCLQSNHWIHHSQSLCLIAVIYFFFLYFPWTLYKPPGGVLGYVVILSLRSLLGPKI